jgi:hypothetical protein
MLVLARGNRLVAGPCTVRRGTFCEQDRETCIWRMDVDEQVRRDAWVERPALVLARAMEAALVFVTACPIPSATVGV